MRRWDRKYKANLSLNMPAWTSRLEMVGGLGVVSLSFATYISSRFTFNTECSRRYSTFLNDSLTLFRENFFHGFLNFIESRVIHHRKSVFVLCHYAIPILANCSVLVSVLAPSKQYVTNLHNGDIEVFIALPALFQPVETAVAVSVSCYHSKVIMVTFGV